MGIETAVLIGAAVVSAGTAYYAGEQQKKAADANADQAEADAAAAAGAAEVEARKIREATRRQQGEAQAALASSGVQVGIGTAELIQQDIAQRGEEDALTTILNGRNRGRLMGREAEALRIGGRNARTAGYLNAGSSLISGYSAYGRASGWRQNGPGYSGGQAPAPVETRSVS